MENYSAFCCDLRILKKEPVALTCYPEPSVIIEKLLLNIQTKGKEG